MLGGRRLERVYKRVIGIHAAEGGADPLATVSHGIVAAFGNIRLMPALEEPVHADLEADIVCLVFFIQSGEVVRFDVAEQLDGLGAVGLDELEAARLLVS